MRTHRFITGLTVSLVAVVWLSATDTAEARGAKPQKQWVTGIAIPRGSPPMYLTTDHLYFTDADDGDSTIFYRITSVSNMNGVTLLINGVPAVRNSRFPQSALVAGNVVAVQHNGAPDTSGTFWFAVVDDEGNQCPTANTRWPEDFTISVTEPVTLLPTLTWVEPDGNEDTIAPGEPFTLKWTDADADDNALIDIYFADGLTSTYIGSTFEDPDGEADEMVWDTTGVPDGSYFLCARVTDKGGTRFFDFWCEHPVTIGSASGGSDWRPPQPVSLTNDTSYTAKALEMDGLGNAMFVHRTGLYEWKYNFFDGTAWGTDAIAPGMLAHSIANPALRSDGAGDYLMVYKRTSDPYSVHAIFYRHEDGWDAVTSNVSPVNPIRTTYWYGNHDAAFSADGHAMVIWAVYKPNNPMRIWTNRFDGAVWQGETSLGTGEGVAIAADGYGNFMAVFAESDGQANEGNIYYALYTNGVGWGPKTLLHNRTTDGQTWSLTYTHTNQRKTIDVAGAGDKKFVAAYILQSAGSDTRGNQVGRRVYGRAFNGTAWQVERRLDNGSDRPIWRGDPDATENGIGLAISPDGTGLTTFAQLNADATPLHEVWANRYDGADWATLAPTRISFPLDATYGRARLLYPPGRRVAMDAAGNGVATFYQVVGATREVVAVHFHPDTGWVDRTVLSATNNDESEYRHWMAGDASGKAIVVWRQDTSANWWSRAYVK
ncbi:MAG: hypothetical protein FJ276_29915 [Planctomycetes bacterium]|nr:hypothetical protein [Planctomycetota bacterium]